MVGRTALHEAAQHGALDSVKVLAETLNANIFAEDINGDTPVALARDSGKMDVVDWLREFRLRIIAESGEDMMVE